MNHDHLIDDVARQMTEAEPPSDLRARVMAALPTKTRRSWLRVAVPASAVAVLALAAVIGGMARLEKSKGPRVQGSKGPDAVTASMGVESPVVAETFASDATRPLDHWTIGPLDRVAELPLPSHVVPLDEVTPLSIAPIQPIGVSIAPITVTPIVTEPLALPALDSRSGGRE